MSQNNIELNTASDSASQLLLEIGTEEIPARFLEPALSDLKNLATQHLGESRVDFADIRTYATPRRIAFIAKGVSQMQKDSVREVFGPAKKAAFDDKGNPTKAALGFASSLGVDPKDLVIRTKGKGEYVAAVVSEKGVETKTILPEMLSRIVLSLRFPKTMRWGSSNLYFARPIHWILALYGEETISFSIDSITSGNMSRGHRFLSPASFQIRDISSYASLLENNFVIPDPAKRKKAVINGMAALQMEEGCAPIIDEGLLDTVNYLVEYPVPVLCSFDAGYLELPKELLLTVMKDHQKYFGVSNSEGRLSNSFVVISNTKADNAETVKTGAERVIRARFDDAKFYFHEDRARKLLSRVDDLAKVTFHDKLGSVYDKTQRVVSIASFLADKINPSLKEMLSRAALLSKTDLLAGVVREFPELQGIMGKYYALNDEEPKEISDALEEQYLPKFLGDRIPQSDTGALLSLSDKIDNIASFFAIGLIPSGSEDPFALRRQAMSIVSILLEKGYPVTLGEIFGFASAGKTAAAKEPALLKSILDFMESRLEYIIGSMGYPADLVKSALPLSTVHPLKAILGRIKSLGEFRTKEFFPDFLLAIKRVYNIIPGDALLSDINTGLLKLDEEKDLYKTVKECSQSVAAVVSEMNFSEGLNRFSLIRPQINSFFDKVLVMDKDEAVRNNRLALLGEVRSIAQIFADFSKLV